MRETAVPAGEFENIDGSAKDAASDILSRAKENMERLEVKSIRRKHNRLEVELFDPVEGLTTTVSLSEPP